MSRQVHQCCQHIFCVNRLQPLGNCVVWFHIYMQYNLNRVCSALGTVSFIVLGLFGVVLIMTFYMKKYLQNPKKILCIASRRIFSFWFKHTTKTNSIYVLVILWFRNYCSYKKMLSTHFTGGVHLIENLKDCYSLTFLKYIQRIITI